MGDTSAPPSSLGKLKSLKGNVAASKSVLATRNPGIQRKLQTGSVKRTRASVYDELEASPEKEKSLKPQPSQQLPQFSPLKKDRKARQHEKHEEDARKRREREKQAAWAIEQAVHAQLQGSAVQSAQVSTNVGMENEKRSHRQMALEEDTSAAARHSSENILYKDHFPPPEHEIQRLRRRTEGQMSRSRLREGDQGEETTVVAHTANAGSLESAGTVGGSATDRAERAQVVNPKKIRGTAASGRSKTQPKAPKPRPSRVFERTSAMLSPNLASTDRSSQVQDPSGATTGPSEEVNAPDGHLLSARKRASPTIEVRPTDHRQPTAETYHSEHDPVDLPNLIDRRESGSRAATDPRRGKQPAASPQQTHKPPRNRKGHQRGAEEPVIARNQPTVERGHSEHEDADASEATENHQNMEHPVSGSNNEKQAAVPHEQPLDSSGNARGQKRGTEETPVANSSQKRQRTERDQHRLYGKWHVIRDVYGKLDHIGCNVVNGDTQDQNDIELRDDGVKQAKKQCEMAVVRCGKLRSNAENAKLKEELHRLLQESIPERVKGLCRDKRDDQARATDIYFHMVPALVKLLRSVVFHSEFMDETHGKHNEISIDSLRTVNHVVGLTCNLIEAAKMYKPRPLSNFNVVQPVERNILIPLRNVRSHFDRQIRDHDERIHDREKRQAEAEELDFLLEKEEIEKAEEARVFAVRKEWQNLHEERRWAEGGIPRRDKLNHLRLSQSEREEDANGDFFERTELFRPRIGPSPSQIDRAMARLWTMQELETLRQGLKEYAGLRVLERTFRRYCPVGEPLNRFNVTEILVTAAWMKQALLTHPRDADHEPIQQWERDIPTKWVAGRFEAGQENEHGVVVDLTNEQRDEE